MFCVKEGRTCSHSRGRAVWEESVGNCGEIFAFVMMGRCLLNRHQCGSLRPGRLGYISAKTDVNGEKIEPFPSNMTAGQVELVQREAGRARG